MPKSKQIRSLQDLELVAGNCRHILTMFSGGLDSSHVLHTLAQAGCRVTALTVDVGDGVNHDDLARIAAHFGASLHIVDGREMFAEKAILPAIQAQARYLGIYPVSSSLSRPVMAHYAVEKARQLGCDAIVHTANQSQNSLRRLNGAITQLGYTGYFGSPYEYSAISRAEKIAILAAQGLTHFQARGISGDANLWCREFESGSLDNPEAFWVPELLFDWTQTPASGLPDPQLSIEFKAGRPVALNGQALPLVTLIERLNRHAGAFGIGRFSGLEHLAGGQKVLEVREAPAASLLLEAYRHLETATLDAELLREKLSQEQLWIREAVEGRWYGTLRKAVEGFIAQTTERVDGVVEFKLRQGAADLCGIRATRPIYLTDRDAWERETATAAASRHLEIHGRERLNTITLRT
ncbi:argininosuccinate synthase [Andreprevotia lacus DSM 23236]|jgi:argininosuccinate synthase|uniref:argininosuccinate synthase n=1 Tax=Andreprevotia lacus DSM 23236 TaxID=1121001 RepID=A0A1W1XFR7_9NEIS|nr:argininosuccinate synthase-related protein [Andreprevotia lacus]SMC22687.1 argininosuccinate synthase [Andreprevotia lacus DSM 23236]